MPLFLEFSLLLVFACGVAIVMRALRQPILIGYILAGIIVGPVLLNIVSSHEVLDLLSQFGVALLLFTVGLNLNPHVIKTYGLVALMAGIGQVLFTASVGTWIATLFGLAFVPALYLGIALAFSSTIIILKLLQENGDTETLYGKISIGILIVQDLIAVLLLFLVPLVAGSGETSELIGTITRGLLLLGVVIAMGIYLLPRAHSFLSRSQELLYLFAIVWGLGISALFQYVGFSIESGALVAGVALAGLPSRRELSAHLSPVRDFFIVLFFIYLGLQLTFGGGSFIVLALVLSFFVLVGNPLILMIMMGLLGYKKRTSFQTGLTVAQISEFSLVFVALGVSLGHVSQEILSLTTIIGITTIFGSTYFIKYSSSLYNICAPYLSIFERKNAKDESIRERNPRALLLGCSRGGEDFVCFFKRKRIPFMVVDYDPDVVASLRTRGMDAEYGDVGDFEYMKTLPMYDLETVVSTVPNLVINQKVLKLTKRKKGRTPLFICTAGGAEEALALYRKGAHHVMVPHLVGSERATDYLKEFGLDFRQYLTRKRRHVQYLKDRLVRASEKL